MKYSWLVLIPGALLLFPGYFFFLWKHGRTRRGRITYLAIAGLLFYGGIFATAYLKA